MRNERTNLVPIERRRAFFRVYLLRLGVVISVLATALTAAAGVLLIPSYVYLVSVERTKTDRLANIETTLASGDEAQLSERLAALSSDADILFTLRDTPSASATLRSLLGVSRPGIVLAGVSYVPDDGGKRGTLAVTGTAETRSALRAYQLALQSAPFAHGAELPVSAYAKDSNIPFTVTVTLVPSGTGSLTKLAP